MMAQRCKYTCFFFFFLMIHTNTFAQKTWQVQESSITFKIKNAGFYVDGSLGDLEASIAFDPETLEGSIEASVKTKTINTDNKSRDKHLRAADYFDVERYPLIIMKSKKIARSQAGNFIGYFDISIKGITKEIKVPFSLKQGVLSGYFDLNRRDFGVGGRSLILGDEVKVTIRLKVS